ncbi:hypothetical protein ACJJTC_002710, partial [Scirpophaga incertulas]
MAGSYIVNVPKLRGRENYDEWAFAAENFLILEGVDINKRDTGDGGANNSEMMQAVIKETKESSQSDSVDELRDSECSDSDLSASTVKSNDNDSTYIEEEPNTNSSSSDESFDSVPAKELKNLQIIKPDKEKRERKKPA